MLHAIGCLPAVSPAERETLVLPTEWVRARCTMDVWGARDRREVAALCGCVEWFPVVVPSGLLARPRVASRACQRAFSRCDAGFTDAAV